jgi:predicted RNA methylase
MDSLAEREQTRQHEQNRLDLFMGMDERNRTGQFATPNALALDIVGYAEKLRPEGPVSFLEPCVGTGSFYSALLQVFGDRVERAAGYEIDPEHVAVARQLWKESGLRVTPGDFTQQKVPRKSFSLLITNPPYVRHHHLGRDDKRRLKQAVKQATGVELSGLSGLYCYFLLLCHAWTEEGGLSIWLVPSEFMDVNYGLSVKRYLTEQVRLLHIHRYCPSDVQFADALVSSCVVVFEKRSPAAGHAVRFSFGGSLLAPDRESTVPLSLLRPADKWTRYPMAEAGKGEAKGVLFGDLFSIKRGLATGDNDFFILERADALAQGIPAQFLRPILPAPRLLEQTVVEADEDGYPLQPLQLALIDCDLTPEEIKRRHPRFWQYLEMGIEKGVHATYLASRRKPWYSQEDRPAPPFLCTYMGRNGSGRKPFRFIRNKSQATAHNVYLLLYPRGELKAALDADPTLHDRVFEALKAIDTGSFVGEGRVYGGGLFKMEPKELGQIPAQFILDAVRATSRKTSA